MLGMLLERERFKADDGRQRKAACCEMHFFTTAQCNLCIVIRQSCKKHGPRDKSVLLKA